jgi:hypothetical protein
VVLRYSLFRAYVAEHFQLLLVVASHAFFLSALLVETRIILGSEAFFRSLLRQKMMARNGYVTKTAVLVLRAPSQFRERDAATVSPSGRGVVWTSITSYFIR